MLWAHYPGRRVLAAAAACILLTAAAMLDLLHVAVGIQGMRAETKVRQPMARAHARLQQWRMDRTDTMIAQSVAVQRNVRRYVCTKPHEDDNETQAVSQFSAPKKVFAARNATQRSRGPQMLSRRCHVTVHAHGRTCSTWAPLPA